ncbi:hypothetical protein TNIN_167441, partial [Trichonephila inaurata madagascariensis]
MPDLLGLLGYPSTLEGFLL